MLTNYDEAETFLLEALEGESLPHDFTGTRSYLLEGIASTFIQADRTSTFNELAIIHEESPWMKKPEDVFNNPLDRGEAEIITLALKKYQNLEAKIARNDNWLNPESKTSDGRDWQSGYRNAIADFLISNGEEANLSLNFFGWREYRTGKLTGFPVAVFHVLEHSVSEFTDTFNDPKQTAGITGEVLLSDGTTIYMRWEGSFSDAIRSITNS